MTWRADGSAHNPRFHDRYGSAIGALAQSEQVFVQGCGLPQAWRDQQAWRVLELGFGLGWNFLATWSAWRADARRAHMLHFCAIEAWPVAADDLLRAATPYPAVLPFAQQLAAQCKGLSAGFHRLVFEQGRLLLTLCVGDVGKVLRELAFEADTVYLDGFAPERNFEMWSVQTMKALARCCRRGTTVATWSVDPEVRRDLAATGFVMATRPGLLPKSARLHGVFNPRWEPKKRYPAVVSPSPTDCLVIGGGLAGASVSAALARRGWRVTVLDQADVPARGASGVPVGLFAAQSTGDDSPAARLSRCGVRATLCAAHDLLRYGEDWRLTGVLERKPYALPRSMRHTPAPEWASAASKSQLELAGLPSDEAATWHAWGGWIKPARLVDALLRDPAITWRGDACVDRLRREGDSWCALDANGKVLGRADLVVLAMGTATQTLFGLDTRAMLGLRAVRGQVTTGRHDATLLGLPPFAVNGQGGFIPAVPDADGRLWLCGASFQRDDLDGAPRAEDDTTNLARLGQLLPRTAAQLATRFGSGDVRGWAGLRCTSKDRMPLLGPANPERWPNLWLSTAMGSRGLSYALVCAELLVAQLHSEPFPMEASLARALAVHRRIGEDRRATSATEATEE